MGLRVVVITTKEERFHRHLCAAIAKRFNVVGVLHPIGRPAKRKPGSARFIDIAAHRAMIWRNGLAHHVLTKLASSRLGGIG